MVLRLLLNTLRNIICKWLMNRFFICLSIFKQSEDARNLPNIVLIKDLRNERYDAGRTKSYANRKLFFA